MFASPFVINPLTGRKIKSSGRTYKKVVKLSKGIQDLKSLVKQQLQKTADHKKYIKTVVLKNDIRELQRDVAKQKEKTKIRQTNAKNVMNKLNVHELVRLVKKQLQKTKEIKKQRNKIAKTLS